MVKSTLLVLSYKEKICHLEVNGVQLIPITRSKALESAMQDVLKVSAILIHTGWPKPFFPERNDFTSKTVHF